MDLLDPMQLISDVFHGGVRAVTATLLSRLLQRPGGTRQGSARQGSARQGSARQGSARLPRLAGAAGRRRRGRPRR
ncbi:hypothetical protein [Pseudosporangium ferrugineum]|uniref:Uncharacterized protein n=1 Tax=Pseudosporangium ferrugineum TaxID=439699 RepID=A0A2T0S9P2_9ACTN|nr:hypothetical protein [Pseudosporangium ferrugineum]PRY30140.1 hypothetical protein CLV70_105310 [Pseudosporangium ferrugineum]